MLQVLLIEDDIIDQLALSRLTKKNKLVCSLTTALEIKGAAQLLQSKNFDLVICDLNLPDGIAFDLGPLIKKQPFILISGHVDSEIIEKAKQHGAVEVLQKSSDLRQLSAIQCLIQSLAEKHPDYQASEADLEIPDNDQFNIQRMLQFFDQNPSEVVNILELFLEDNPLKFKELLLAIEREDRESIYIVAHKLKSNFNFLGLSSVQKLAKKLEAESKSTSLEQLKNYAYTLQQHAQAVYPEIQLALQVLK